METPVEQITHYHSGQASECEVNAPKTAEHKEKRKEANVTALFIQM